MSLLSLAIVSPSSCTRMRSPDQQVPRTSGAQDHGARNHVRRQYRHRRIGRRGLTPEEAEQFQKYLLYSHAAGCGEPCAEDDARAGILSRLNTHCWGHSGIRLEIVQTQVEMLNKGVTPVMCQKGSVGACGDLAPMAQGAITMMGEGEVFFQGKRLPAKEGMAAAGIPTDCFPRARWVGRHQRFGPDHGHGLPSIYDAERWLKTQEIALAMTLEALNANMNAYDQRLARGARLSGRPRMRRKYPHADRRIGTIRRPGKKVQDAYSLRSCPQVVGAARDACKWSRHMLEIELNHAADNPVFFPDEDLVLTGANFQGTPMAFGLELLGMSLTTIAVFSERRLNRLMNPHLSMGLPAFLTKGAGMFSGLMLSQYTAGALVCENRVLSHPAATGSIPAAADQEDFRVHGHDHRDQDPADIENCWHVIAIELMAAAQPSTFARRRPRPRTQAAFEVIRNMWRNSRKTGRCTTTSTRWPGSPRKARSWRLRKRLSEDSIEHVERRRTA